MLLKEVAPGVPAMSSILSHYRLMLPDTILHLQGHSASAVPSVQPHGNTGSLPGSDGHGAPVDHLASPSVLRDATNSCKQGGQKRPKKKEGSQHFEVTLRDGVEDLAPFPCPHRPTCVFIVLQSEFVDCGCNHCCCISLDPISPNGPVHPVGRLSWENTHCLRC